MGLHRRPRRIQIINKVDIRIRIVITIRTQPLMLDLHQQRLIIIIIIIRVTVVLINSNNKVVGIIIIQGRPVVVVKVGIINVEVDIIGKLFELLSIMKLLIVSIWIIIKDNFLLDTD